MKHLLLLAVFTASACASSGTEPSSSASSGAEARAASSPSAAAATPQPTASAGPNQPALSNDQIRDVIRAHPNEVQACYQQALARDPNRGGRVLVAFVIGTDGRVTRSEVRESTLGDAEAERCIAGVVSGLTFPRPSRGIVEARYPFEFRPIDRDRDGLD